MSEANKRARIEYLQSLVAEYRERAEKAEATLAEVMARTGSTPTSQHHSTGE